MQLFRFVESRRFAWIVVATGVAGGVVGAAYLAVLELATDLLGPDRWAAGPHVAVLVAVGAAIALLVRRLGAPADVELLVDDIHVLGGPDEARGLRSLVPVSMLAVAAGSALGPEAPLVTTTGVLGSTVARRTGLERDQLRIVTITGMAAGFTVLFGAPLGAAVFALEILHRRGMEYYEALMPAVVGSLGGYAVATAVGAVGLDPMWTFPPVAGLHEVDLAWAVGAGVAGAVVAYAFTHLTLLLRRVVGIVPPGLRPALGGLVLGLLALATPYALTNGELQIEHLTTERVAVGAFLVAAGVKLVAAVVSLVCGWRGGFIIPLFFVGYCLARAAAGQFAGAEEWPLVASLMVACNVGVTKTPLGSTLVVSEMAGMAVLPTTLVSAMVSLVLTSDVGLIDSQRRRLGIGEEGDAPRETAPDIDAELLDLDGPDLPMGRVGAAPAAEDPDRPRPGEVSAG